MGIIIANWSPLHGRGNTSNCIAIAMQLSLKYNIEVFATHTHYKRSTMESALLKGNEDEDILKLSDLGLDSLNRAIKTGFLDVSEVKSYCNKLSENFSLIGGTRKSNSELFDEELGKDIRSICEFIKQDNNVTFIDIDSGYQSEVAKDIIDLADFVIVTLDQTNLMVEEYFSSEHRISKSKELILIGRYDGRSKYTKKYISKKFKNKEVFALPLDADYLDALNNHRVKEFFDKNYDRQDDLFFDELNSIVDDIAYRINESGMIISKKQEETKKKLAFFSISV